MPLLAIFIGLATLILVGCQNTAGQTGERPSNCAVPGSSCSKSSHPVVRTR
jgi:hypothetical protein